ncbi:MAG: hypothetical protein ABSD31_18560, partial [Candidatus Binataceae bacterium]
MAERWTEHRVEDAASTLALVSHRETRSSDQKLAKLARIMGLRVVGFELDGERSASALLSLIRDQ